MFLLVKAPFASRLCHSGASASLYLVKLDLTLVLPWQWAIAEAQSWPLGAAETTRSVRCQGAKDTGPGFPGHQSRPKR